MSKLFVTTDYVDRTDEDRPFRLGRDPECEAFTDDRGRLYRSCVREFGRCTGKVYIDDGDGAHAIGWTFLKRVPYDDKPSKTWLRETWVSVREEAES